MSPGRKLKELREAAGLSQAKLAKIAGVSRNAVSQWEAGLTNPSTKRLSVIARSLNVSVDQIMSPSEKIRDRIIDQATRFFDRLGPDETSIEVICAAADVSRIEFESLFPTKNDLLYAVLKEYNNRTFDDVRRIPPQYGPIDARLQYLLRMYYVHDLMHLKLTAALHAYSWQWSAAQERDNAQQMSNHHETVLLLLESAAEGGEVLRGNFRAASQLILACYTYGLRKAVFENYDAEQLVEYIKPQIRIILSGLRPSGPTAS
ncbi:MAG: helix-turn-helix domain-containing protein [Hyphomicrobiaceae bacterium]